MKQLNIYQIREGSEPDNGGLKTIYNIVQVDVYGNEIPSTASCVCTAKHLAERIALLLMTHGYE